MKFELHSPLFILTTVLLSFAFFYFAPTAEAMGKRGSQFYRELTVSAAFLVALVATMSTFAPSVQASVGWSALALLNGLVLNMIWDLAGKLSPLPEAPQPL